MQLLALELHQPGDRQERFISVRTVDTIVDTSCRLRLETQRRAGAVRPRERPARAERDGLNRRAGNSRARVLIDGTGRRRRSVLDDLDQLLRGRHRDAFHRPACQPAAGDAQQRPAAATPRRPACQRGYRLPAQLRQRIGRGAACLPTLALSPCASAWRQPVPGLDDPHAGRADRRCSRPTGHPGKVTSCRTRSPRCSRGLQGAGRAALGRGAADATPRRWRRGWKRSRHPATSAATRAIVSPARRPR